MIGNDIVDFADPSLLRAYLRPRFVERTCNRDERAKLNESAQPGPRICALFAAKEAAYKAVVKIDPGITFAHSRFAVSPRLDHVRYEHLRLRLRLTTGDNWVHAVAWLGCPPPYYAIDCIPDNVDPGAAVRALARRHVAHRIGRPARDVALLREERSGAWDGLGPPKLIVAGVAEPLDVSLSHDGRMVAFAAARCSALAKASLVDVGLLPPCAPTLTTVIGKRTFVS